MNSSKHISLETFSLYRCLHGYASKFIKLILRNLHRAHVPISKVSLLMWYLLSRPSLGQISVIPTRTGFVSTHVKKRLYHLLSFHWLMRRRAQVGMWRSILLTRSCTACANMAVGFEEKLSALFRCLYIILEDYFSRSFIYFGEGVGWRNGYHLWKRNRRVVFQFWQMMYFVQFPLRWVWITKFLHFFHGKCSWKNMSQHATMFKK